MAKTGRPTKITEKLTREICRYLERGAPEDVASWLSGIDPRTFYNAARSVPDFLRATKTAQAKFVWLLIQAAMKFAIEGKQWAGIVTIGERLKHQYFGRVERHEVSGPGGQPLEIDQRAYIVAIREALGFVERRDGKPRKDIDLDYSAPKALPGG